MEPTNVSNENNSQNENDQTTASDVYGIATNSFNVYSGFLRDVLNKANDISSEVVVEMHNALDKAGSDLSSAASDLRGLPIIDVAFGYQEDGYAGAIKSMALGNKCFKKE